MVKTYKERLHDCASLHSVLEERALQAEEELANAHVKHQQIVQELANAHVKHQEIVQELWQNQHNHEQARQREMNQLVKKQKCAEEQLSRTLKMNCHLRSVNRDLRSVQAQVSAHFSPPLSPIKPQVLCNMPVRVFLELWSYVITTNGARLRGSVVEHYVIPGLRRCDVVHTARCKRCLWNHLCNVVMSNVSVSSVRSLAHGCEAGGGGAGQGRCVYFLCVRGVAECRVLWQRPTTTRGLWMCTFCDGIKRLLRPCDDTRVLYTVLY
jgi:hypothetical protein